jgi:hypothetical protein
MKTESKPDKLTPEEEAQLRLWASATPAQRLAWLEEVVTLAWKAGATKE